LIPFSKIAAISFDAGGTLIRPYPSVGHVYSEILSNHGVTVEPSLLNRSFRIALKEETTSRREKVTESSEKSYWCRIVRKTIGSTVDNGLFGIIFEDLYETFASAKRWELIEGAKEILFLARDLGFRLCVLSNSDQRFRKVFKELNILPFFEEIFLSSEIGIEKPNTRAFRHVESVLKLSPEELLHVGDSIDHDANGAIAAGWHHLLVERNQLPDPYRQIDSLQEFIPLLENRTFS
tara:strand:- start:14509 stop:15216 length:708 start_codon:yes stop_codon:yes gene_type:complete